MPWQRKRYVPQLLRRFKGLREACTGDARRKRERARCWRLPWTEPDKTRHAGQQKSIWEIDLDISRWTMAGKGWYGSIEYGSRL
jgi:hypothetical protein